MKRKTLTMFNGKNVSPKWWPVEPWFHRTLIRPAIKPYNYTSNTKSASPDFPPPTCAQFYIYYMRNITICSSNGEFTSNPVIETMEDSADINCYLSQPGMNVLGHVIVDVMMKIWYLSTKFNHVRLLFNHENPGLVNMLKPFIDTFPCKFEIVKIKTSYDCKKLIHIPRLISYDTPHCLFYRSMMSHLINCKNQYITDTNSQQHDRVFLSRGKWKRNKRKLQNLHQIEQVFKDHGFHVIYPETINFFELISVLQSCTVLAGEKGSALHISGFIPSVTDVISLNCETDNTVLQFMQSRICEQMGQRCHYVFGQEISRVNGDEFIYEIDGNDLENYLKL